MTKELFVSSTPHETKVGMVEDDLLAEIYLERENEYTLAGSIYKGRVTRVLPGMQSAFVDIGLERDAFLYVSDFMELEDSEDLDDVPTKGPAPERFERSSRPERSERFDRADRTDREHAEYGPPPGYQPIILPGESISKYQRMAPTRPSPPSVSASANANERLAAPTPEQPGPPISQIFAGDEPLFAESVQASPKTYEERATTDHEPVVD